MKTLFRVGFEKSKQTVNISVYDTEHYSVDHMVSEKRKDRIIKEWHCIL